MFSATARNVSLWVSTHILQAMWRELAGPVNESLARRVEWGRGGRAQYHFSDAKYQNEFAATKSSRTMGQSVHINKAGGHVVVYVRATCWVELSKWPLLGHFRPSGKQPLNPDICVSDCLAGTSHSKVAHRALGGKKKIQQKKKQADFLFGTNAS